MNNDSTTPKKTAKLAAVFRCFFKKILLDGEIFENLKGSCFFHLKKVKIYYKMGPYLL